MKHFHKSVALMFSVLFTNAFAGPGDPFNGIDVSLIDKSTGSAIAFDGDATMLIDKSTGSYSLTTNLSYSGQDFIFHDLVLYEAGTYSIDTSLGGGNSETGIFDFAVGAGQLGGGGLIDWNGFTNIDFVNVWDGDGLGTSLLDTDWDGDGFTGGALNPSGPFAGFSLSINAPAPVPVPPALLLFLSGLTGLLGVTRRKNSAHPG